MSGIKGLVHSSEPGRADNLTKQVKRGTYIVPADVVSALGEGNTMAGAHKIRKVMNKLPKMAYADGGGTDPGDIEIRISGGEFMIDPEHVRALGSGDIRKGSDFLDKAIRNLRSIYADKLTKLPGPK